MGWTITEEDQLTKINLGAKDNVQRVKVNSTLESIVTYQLFKLLKEFKNVFAWTYEDLKGIHQRLLNTILNWIP